ncbi:MAG: hypothetical protein AAF629_19765 [Chloroflexota bacterium]
MAAIAEVLGRHKDVRWYRERGKQVSQTSQEKLIDPVTGLVLDGEGSTTQFIARKYDGSSFWACPASKSYGGCQSFKGQRHGL